ncbi:MAG: hypothetical protein A2X48_05390 [Lentisphaerae bacterium GWF2_49_21]|nr:MAG: hypothetical protein A2X48_05390 [Lentisphaerae bacterium GWF2_49_21]
MKLEIFKERWRLAGNNIMKLIVPMVIFFSAFLGSAQNESEKKYLIEDVPAVLQRADFCGEACIEMYLKKLGVEVTQDDVFNVSGLEPALGRGCYTRELLNAMKALGFKLGDLSTTCPKVNPAKPEEIEKCFNDMIADLKRGKPSIVCTHYNDAANSSEHFRLILGYDPASDEILYNEPAEENGAYRKMKKEVFLKLWPLKYSADEWSIIRIVLDIEKSKVKIPERKKPQVKKIIGKTGAVEEVRSLPPTNADLMQHVRNLKQKYAGRKLNYIVEPPFVVVGDLDAVTLKGFSEKTIRWTVNMLMKSYFEYYPSRILTIWLLKDADSFGEYCKLITGNDPHTPYGFYSSQNDCLIMNIGTGGGTLVHEIVHPFIEANFPGCPSWLNEGLGSLYEQCSERNGQIAGLTNWRLAGLQKAIKRNDLPDFETLTGYSVNEFYGGTKGDNYAQSRYLCYYLQEKGLLVKFYKEFNANYHDDPTGYKSLMKILDVKDMKQFQSDWQKYVMKLTFP